MSFRTDILPTVDEIRTLRGPDPGFDIQTVLVTIVRRTWTGGRRGAGTFTDEVLTALPPWTKVREVSERLVATSGGRLETGDVRVGPMTPTYGSGGVTHAELVTPGATGEEIVYVLSGTMAGDYTVVDTDTAKAFSYFMTLRRTSP